MSSYEFITLGLMLVTLVLATPAVAEYFGMTSQQSRVAYEERAPQGVPALFDTFRGTLRQVCQLVAAVIVADGIATLVGACDWALLSPEEASHYRDFFSGLLLLVSMVFLSLTVHAWTLPRRGTSGPELVETSEDVAAE